MIPPTLHFIWFQREVPFGETQQAAIDFALRNTSYQIKVWTNIPEVFSTVSDRLTVCKYDFIDKKNIRVAILCDIARLEILSKEGGIYSDIDFYWLKDWDLNTNHNLVAVYENPSYKIVCNSVFACCPGFDFSEPIQRIKEQITKIGDKDKTVFTVKNHLFGMKITGNYFKTKADIIERKKSKFFLNTWRKLDRDEPLNINTTAIHLSATLGHSQKYLSRLKILTTNIE